jgi:hypothetical protein
MHSTISRSSNQDSFADVALIIPDFVTIFIHEDILEIIPNNKSGHLGPLHPGGSDHRSGTRWSPNNSVIAITIALVRDIDRCNTDAEQVLYTRVMDCPPSLALQFLMASAVFF